MSDTTQPQPPDAFNFEPGSPEAIALMRILERRVQAHAEGIEIVLIKATAECFRRSSETVGDLRILLGIDVDAPLYEAGPANDIPTQRHNEVPEPPEESE